MELSRRHVLVAASAALFVGPLHALSQEVVLSLMTAGPGSGFLPYGQGLVSYMATRSGPKLEIKDSTGSLVNLKAVEASPTTIGTVFLGSAFDGLNGLGPFNGQKLVNIRALFPMYETSFQAAVLAGKGMSRIRDLNGKRVGVGPAGGPAELFFRAVAEAANITPSIVNGTSADQTQQLLSGEIDAFWQGAIVPIPALKAAADQADVTIIGIDEADIPAVLTRFPTLSAATVPAGSYRGQLHPVRSIAAWNFVVAHKDMPEELAARITRLAMSAADPARDIHPSAAGTRKENTSTNSVLAFHPGAISAFRDMGISVK